MFLIHEWARRHNVAGVALTELMALLDPVQPPIVDPSSTSEADTQARCRVEAPKNGASLWRNNNGATMDETGRMIRYGLGNDSKKLNEVWKSSDTIGITPRMSTAPGQVFGVFTAVEVKHPGWTKPANARDRAQANFHATVRGLGGIAMFVQSVDDYRRLFR